MRFLGLVVVLSGATVAYFLGYRGFSVDQMRTRLAQLLNLPGLTPPASSGGPANNSAQSSSGPSKVVPPYNPSSPLGFHTGRNV
jgi:hypothetical protein